MGERSQNPCKHQGKNPLYWENNVPTGGSNSRRGGEPQRYSWGTQEKKNNNKSKKNKNKKNKNKKEEKKKKERERTRRRRSLCYPAAMRFKARAPRVGGLRHDPHTGANGILKRHTMRVVM